MNTDTVHKALTPSMVAKTFFRKELEQHEPHSRQVVVIVHDSCYGHRFSRPKTSKAQLNTIVERPERIQATLLGASLAYVRLGGRHADGDYPPHHHITAPSHSTPFQIHKTTRYVPLNHLAVTAVHGTKWMEELQILCDSAEAKLAMNGKELIRPIGYGKDENGKPLPKLHEGDLYLCSDTLAALQGCLGGVCEAVDTVFAGKATKRAFVCIRPPGHHCSADFPSGFCWLNNVHVGITYASMHHGLTHAAIIDFDLHHGDGSQTIAWNHNTKAKELPKNAAAHKKTPIGYYSLHDINSYPCEWGDEEKIRNASICIENAHGLSIWNVHLEEWADKSEFWRLYEARYLILLEKTRKFLRYHSKALRANGVQPRAAIFLSAGFDASEWETPGMQRHSVNVPTEFYARFTSDIVKLSQEEDLGVDGRIISVLEGGYSDRALTSGVLSHICGLVDADRPQKPPGAEHGLGASMSSFGAAQPNMAQSVERQNVHSPHASWWDVEALESVEAIVAGRLPPIPRDLGEKAQGNYSSPTHASSARMTDTARERRSLNAQIEARLSLAERPPPPPPDVEWHVAAYELSRLIIPDDRQVASCRPNELNAEATRLRKERQSGVGVPVSTILEPMQLRERRTRANLEPLATVRASSRTRSESRRTTIASFNDLPDPGEPLPPLPSSAARPRRRSSTASSIVSSLAEMKLSNGTQDAAIPSAGIPTTNNAPIRSLPKAIKSAAVKKPRAPASKVASATQVPSKKGVDGPLTLSRQTSSISEKMPAALQQASSNQARQASANSDTTDIDSLTNAMKKTQIRLKMPTKEQHEQNQIKAEQDQQKKVSKPARKLPESHVPKAKPVAKAVPTSTTSTVPSKPVAGPVPDVPDISMSTSASAEMPPLDPTPATLSPTATIGFSSISGDIPVTSASAAGEEAVTDTAHTTKPITHAHAMLPPPPPLPSAKRPALPPSPNLTNGAVHGTPVDDPIPLAIQDLMDVDQVRTANDVQHAHPAVVNPTPKPWDFVTSVPRPSSSAPGSRPITPQKHQLPKFTSTSPIPFGNRQPATPAEDTIKHENTNIWEFPDTPR